MGSARWQYTAVLVEALGRCLELSARIRPPVGRPLTCPALSLGAAPAIRLLPAEPLTIAGGLIDEVLRLYITGGLDGALKRGVLQPAAQSTESEGAGRCELDRDSLAAGRADRAGELLRPRPAICGATHAHPRSAGRCTDDRGILGAQLRHRLRDRGVKPCGAAPGPAGRSLSEPCSPCPELGPARHDQSRRPLHRHQPHRLRRTALRWPQHGHLLRR